MYFLKNDKFLEVCQEIEEAKEREKAMMEVMEKEKQEIIAKEPYAILFYQMRGEG